MMNDWTSIELSDLNRSQQRGAQRVINQINERVERLAKYEAVSEIELNRCGSLVSIIARVKMPKLGEGNLLRYLEESEYFHCFIGRRGAVNAVTFPKSFDQFKGRRAFGINIKGDA